MALLEYEKSGGSSCVKNNETCNTRELATLFHTINDFDFFEVNEFELSRNSLSREVSRSPYLNKHSIEIFDSPNPGCYIVYVKNNNNHLGAFGGVAD
ncbi:MAG: hypothetical protein AABW50_01655 [Nanoarchaeota archaeon]